MTIKYFIEKYCVIKNKNTGKEEHIKLNAAQVKFLNYIQNENKVHKPTGRRTRRSYK
jgi:hypothetical protein